MKKENTENFPPKKKIFNNNKIINILNPDKVNSNSVKKIDKRKKRKKGKKIKGKTSNLGIVKKLPEKTKNKEKSNLTFNDYELNTFQFKNAILYDNRKCYEYYISLLKTKHPILFSFCPIKDYNLLVIKSCLFCLSFSIYYSVTYFFFDDKMLHKIYEDEGKYDFIYFLPKIIISFVISHFLSIILKLIFLSERNILQVKIQPTLFKAIEVESIVKRRITIKYLIFFILGLIILGFFWMLLSSFGAVYQNTHIIVFENTLISFAISFIYPIFINIFPTVFRMYGLHSNSEYLYNISKILQML